MSFQNKHFQITELAGGTSPNELLNDKRSRSRDEYVWLQRSDKLVFVTNTSSCLYRIVSFRSILCNIICTRFKLTTVTKKTLRANRGNSGKIFYNKYKRIKGFFLNFRSGT